jgi:hypothetical protein
MGKVVIKKSALHAGWTKSARDVGSHKRTGRRRIWADVVSALETTPTGHVRVKMGSRNSAHVTRYNLMQKFKGLNAWVDGSHLHLRLKESD